MTPTLGADLSIDVDRLVSTRMLLTANSGAGKSWALRRLLEQTHGAIQHLVIDPEGEFFTLRERFDYVLAGRGGDCPAEPRSAGLLARRLLELGTSAVLDLYELAPRDRVRFVRADGFTDGVSMLEWFARTHGLPFRGHLIRWRLLPREEWGKP